jgi:nitroreductase|tara:strand:+ start:2503 stop:3174 length:672 start_codon:yes stop_codon:yes gene_type:complete
MTEPRHIPLTDQRSYSVDETVERSRNFYQEIKRRRTVRDFSDQPVSREVIENCILAAGTAPNGANLQPWHFSVVENLGVKTEIRKAAEQEEEAFYNGKAPQTWLDALAPLGTDSNKPFLETAPYLIVIFSKSHEQRNDGSTVKNYYANESTGIATGFLIAALHDAGLATLTHTPSPMKFLNKILNRPAHERPFVLLVVGYPSESAVVPDISKKSLAEISNFIS